MTDRRTPANASASATAAAAAAEPSPASPDHFFESSSSSFVLSAPLVQLLSSPFVCLCALSPLILHPSHRPCIHPPLPLLLQPLLCLSGCSTDARKSVASLPLPSSVDHFVPHSLPSFCVSPLSFSCVADPSLFLSLSSLSLCQCWDERRCRHWRRQRQWQRWSRRSIRQYA